MYSFLIFGDSLSFGRGEIPNNGWVQRFKNSFEDVQVHKGVYNLSIPGETSHSLLKRLEQETTPRVWHRKDNDKYVIVLQVGGNDAKSVINNHNPATKPEQFKENVNTIIDKAKTLVDEVIVMGLLKVDEEKTQPFETNVYFSNEEFKVYNEMLKDVSKEKQVQFIDTFNNVSLTKEEYFDGVHPNKEGHENYTLILLKISIRSILPFLMRNKLYKN